jgi:hypothetical protein
MRKTLLRLIIGAACIAIGVGGQVGSSVEKQTQPYCPQEDSCYPDYHNGSWHIIEGNR